MELRSAKRTLFFAAALLATLPTTASAQYQGLQVFVFGDAGVVSQSNRPFTTAAGATPATSLSLNSGPWQASRLGFRGRFKLDDDFEAWFDAATTLNLTQGLVGNPTAPNSFFLFDRNAFVGVASKKYGNLTFGRHPGMVTEALWVTDPLKANNGATNPNVRFGYMVAPGPTVYQNFGPNPGSNNNGIALDRQSNSARYVYGNSGFLGMAMYGFGGAAGDRTRNQYAGALLGYDSDRAPSHGPSDRSLADAPYAFSLRLAGQVHSDSGTVAGTAGAPNVVSLYAASAGAVARLGPVKLKASYSGHQIDDTAFYRDLAVRVAAGGVTYMVGDLDLTLAAYNVNRRISGAPIQDATKLYFVPEYYVSKNFWLYAIADYEILNSFAATVPTATGTAAAVTGLGPVDANATGGNVLVPGVKSTTYLGIGISFFFNS